MSQELQLGKYEFYPYELDKSKTLTLEDLKALLRKAKLKRGKDVKMPTGIDPTPGGKRRGANGIQDFN